jgi:high affinity Mn2+ porin
MIIRSKTALIFLGVACWLGQLASLAAAQGAPTRADASVSASASPPSPNGPAQGDTAPPPKTSWLDQAYDRHPWLPRLLAAQFTYVGQNLFPFHAAYSGPNSLLNTGQYEATQTYGIYIGSRVTSELQAYLDVEVFRGAGVSRAIGLAGLTNGDVVREGSVNLGQGPYIARAYLEYFIPIGAARDTITRAQDQVPGPQPSTRFMIKAGRFALSDDFDNNRYANQARTEFLNWGLWNNTAWDYAADTRGYTTAVVVGFVSPGWSIKLAGAQMPTMANGNVLDDDIANAYGLNGELTLQPGPVGTVVRVLAYENHARMGIYRKAIEIGQANDTTPDVAADDAPGRIKYGFGLNLEQPITDGGNTGIFARLGWDDGNTESFVFTEADRHVSTGLQLAGNSWHRPQDRFGVGLLLDGLSAPHKDYLAAGGLGFLLGDGALSYGYETVGEMYYLFTVPVLTFCSISPDYQYITNPGYNRARGPASVLTIRVHLQY